LLWTEASDARLRRLRAEGEAGDAIAAALGVSRWTVIERGRRSGARKPPPEHRPTIDLAREALPAGHPVSWGALTEGTVLQGAPYPWPVFL